MRGLELLIYLNLAVWRWLENLLLRWIIQVLGGRVVSELSCHKDDSILCIGIRYNLNLVSVFDDTLSHFLVGIDFLGFFKLDQAFQCADPHLLFNITVYFLALKIRVVETLPGRRVVEEMLLVLLDTLIWSAMERRLEVFLQLQCRRRRLLLSC